MTESSNNVVMAQLRAIRETLDGHSLEFHTLGQRMVALEQHMAALLSQLPPVWEEIAGLKRRMERVERRLELTEG